MFKLGLASNTFAKTCTFDEKTLLNETRSCKTSCFYNFLNVRTKKFGLKGEKFSVFAVLEIAKI